MNTWHRSSAVQSESTEVLAGRFRVSSHLLGDRHVRGRQAMWRRSEDGWSPRCRRHGVRILVTALSEGVTRITESTVKQAAGAGA